MFVEMSSHGLSDLKRASIPLDGGLVSVPEGLSKQARNLASTTPYLCSASARFLCNRQPLDRTNPH